MNSKHCLFSHLPFSQPYLIVNGIFYAIKIDLGILLPGQISILAKVTIKGALNNIVNVSYFSCLLCFFVAIKMEPLIGINKNDEP